MNTPQQSQPKIDMEHINALLSDPVKVQIVEAISHTDLSSKEISEMLSEDNKKIAEGIAVLEDAHVIERHTDEKHAARYSLALPELEQVIHILYKLWSDALVSNYQYASVRI